MSMFKLLACLGVLILGTSGAYIGFQMLDWGGSGLAWGNGRQSGQMIGAPGPVAGAGLSLLAVAGGYVWLRSRRSNKRSKPGG